MASSPKPFPSNDWLSQRLAGGRTDATVPRLHGFLRGAQAGPLGVTLDQALASLRARHPGAAPEDPGFLAGVSNLWDAIAHAYQKGGVFPPAIGHHPGTDQGNRALVGEIVDLLESFLDGYTVAEGPVGGTGWGKDGKEEALSPEVEDLLDDLGVLLRAMDELDEEIGKEGIVGLQTRLLYEGLARLEKGMRGVARASRRRGLPSADPSAARKGARRRRRGEP